LLFNALYGWLGGLLLLLSPLLAIRGLLLLLKPLLLVGEVVAALKSPLMLIRGLLLFGKGATAVLKAPYF